MRRPPTYNSYFGAGFGKKHFKGLEKKAHKHVGKIFAAAKKAHRAAHTKAGKSKTKAQRKRDVKNAIAAAHKEAKGGFIADHKVAVEKLKAEIKKKGAGMSVGAGTKVGAGVKKKGGFLGFGPKVAIPRLPKGLLKTAMKRAQPMAFKAMVAQIKAKEAKKKAKAKAKKKGAGTKVGAGMKCRVCKKGKRKKAVVEEY